MACLDPLLPPPHLPSPARIRHQDIFCDKATSSYISLPLE
jgi:hypothetical protein